MKQLPILALVCVLFFALIACSNTSSEQSVVSSTSEKEVEISDSTPIDESENYLENRDFDGDKISDHLSFHFTGGAHCCYKMVLKLSSLKDTIKYPFEMDGGYVFGVDGSQPEQFNIGDFDEDGLPEIFMRISTYNGEEYPIDPELTSEYGIKSNHIIFNYSNGAIVLEDYDEKKHITKP